ncbi:hypothetical protein FVE85_1676 [Porphyridium purpureum]|uniref:Transmembrane protein n=1 Tax=Porphyridium purpureum TaxID=35688 RepID=A0A5J4YVJ6_PORPP|nr:hypothetical protein FVE85_4575 [Porphyridium purpureum]KAA8495521.1 hypothetical protein FVE85_1676 [Porphyridium purpureum]|eukprot:POR1885..scf209_3
MEDAGGLETTAPSTSGNMDHAVSAAEDSSSNGKEEAKPKVTSKHPSLLASDPTTEAQFQNYFQRMGVDAQIIEDLVGVEVDEFERLPFWKTPQRGSKVKYPEKWRKYKENGKEDPFEYYGCGLWWWSWMILGADQDTLELPEAFLPTLADKFHWKLPPVGLERSYHPLFDREHIDLPDALKRHVNLQTIPHVLGLGHVVRWFLQRSSVFGFIFFLSVISIALPSIYCLIFFGVIPLGDFLECGFREFAVWVFVTNPINEVVWAFADVTLMFAALDRTLPWRNFFFYFPMLLTVYCVQCGIWAAISATVGTFTCQALVSRSISYCIVLSWYKYLKRPFYHSMHDRDEVREYKDAGLTLRKTLALLNPRGEGRKYQLTDDENADYNQWLKISFTRMLMFMVFAAYMIASKAADDNIKTLIAFIFSMFSVAFRKVIQHQAMRFSVDMNFALSGLSVYSMSAAFIAFSTPNIDNDDDNYSEAWGTYLALFSGPLSHMFVAFFHQSNLWFRFRNWIKKILKPLLMCAPVIDYSAFPVEVDMDFNGRGTTNAHPDYRRAKSFFDFFVFWGSLSAYAAYIFISWIFLVGLNTDAFPFNDSSNVALNFFDNRSFTWTDYAWSLGFSGIVAVLMFIFFAVYVWYVKRFYPDVFGSLLANMWDYGLHPFKLGFAVLIITVSLCDSIIMLMTFSRVWYFGSDFGRTNGSCL